MGGLLDLAGKKFGQLTAVCQTASDIYNHSQWRCKCQCGKRCTVRASNLVTGNTKSCGCFRGTKDLTGQKFGRLTAMRKGYKTKNSGGRSATWVCRCECGMVVGVRGRNLASGSTKSCGCWQSERSSIANTTHGFIRKYGRAGKRAVVFCRRNKFKLTEENVKLWRKREQIRQQYAV